MGEAQVVPEFETLRAASPEAHDFILDALAHADHAIDPALLEPMRRRIVAGFGGDDGTEWIETPLDDAIAELTDQFVFFVAGATPEMLKPLEDALSVEDLHEFVKVLYTIDMGYRLRKVHQGLFAPDADPLAPLPARTPDEGSSMDANLKQSWRVATTMADEVVDDPEAIEFLRLRCASYHDCHT